eukprot:946469-Rhodomonas_salina.1
MSCTRLACPYAIPGPETMYPDAMSGTRIAYGATDALRCPVLGYLYTDEELLGDGRGGLRRVGQASDLTHVIAARPTLLAVWSWARCTLLFSQIHATLGEMHVTWRV